MNPGDERRSQRPYLVAFVISAMLMLAILGALPFSLASVVDDVLGPATGKVFPLLRASPSAIAADHARLHLAVIGIDEVQLLATLRISGNRVCRGTCAWRDRLLLVSISPTDDGEAEGLPPSVTVLLPDVSEAVSETVQLAVSGVPVRYPFDWYRLVLGVAFQRVYPDGRVESLAPDETARHLLLTIQEMLPRKHMWKPAAVDRGSVRLAGSPVAYAAVYALTFEHPRYLRVLAVLLVLLIAAAAAYSVFFRPLGDLLVNSGGLVLSVWGVRSILTPGNLFYITAIDLALSMVILFTLSGLVVKVLMFAHDRGGLRVLRRARRAGQRETDS
jgi:hypothetical protein